MVKRAAALELVNGLAFRQQMLLHFAHGVARKLIYFYEPARHFEGR